MGEAGKIDRAEFVELVAEDLERRYLEPGTGIVRPKRLEHGWEFRLRVSLLGRGAPARAPANDYVARIDDDELEEDAVRSAADLVVVRLRRSEELEEDPLDVSFPLGEGELG